MNIHPPPNERSSYATDGLPNHSIVKHVISFLNSEDVVYNETLAK